MTSEPSASRGDPGQTFAQNAPDDRSAIVVVSSDFPKKSEIISKIEECIGEVQVSEVRLLSADQNYLLQLLLDAATWTNLLKVVATVFLSRVAQLAADDLWKLKKRIFSRLWESPNNPISKLAEILAQIKQQDPRVEIRLGLPLPDRHSGVLLRVEGSDDPEIAQLIVELAAAAPTIEEEVKGISQADGWPLTGIHLSMSADGTFTAFWHDGTGRRSVVIRHQAGVEKEHQP